MVYEVIESCHDQNPPLFEVELPRVETVQLVLCRLGQLPVILCSKCQRPFSDDSFFMERGPFGSDQTKPLYVKNLVATA